MQYILCQACHSVEILEMVSSRSLVCEIASRIYSAPLRPPLHPADLTSLLYSSTASKCKGFVKEYCTWYSAYCLLAHSKLKSGFTTRFKSECCTVYPCISLFSLRRSQQSYIWSYRLFVWHSCPRVTVYMTLQSSPPQRSTQSCVPTFVVYNFVYQE